MFFCHILKFSKILRLKLRPWLGLVGLLSDFFGKKLKKYIGIYFENSFFATKPEFWIIIFDFYNNYDFCAKFKFFEQKFWPNFWPKYLVFQKNDIDFSEKLSFWTVIFRIEFKLITVQKLKFSVKIEIIIKNQTLWFKTQVWWRKSYFWP